MDLIDTVPTFTIGLLLLSPNCEPLDAAGGS